MSAGLTDEQLAALERGSKRSDAVRRVGHTNIDDAITAAATKHGVDPKLLRAVGMQESNLGAALDAQHRGDYGHGYGIFQLDDQRRPGATPRPQELLNRAANDPEFAADYAAKMLRGLLDQYGGDVRKALSAYNSGSPNAVGTLTNWGGKMLGYADSVLRHYQSFGGASASGSMSGTVASAGWHNHLQKLDDRHPHSAGLTDEQLNALASPQPQGGLTDAQLAAMAAKPSESPQDASNAFGAGAKVQGALSGALEAGKRAFAGAQAVAKVGDFKLQQWWDWARAHPVDQLFDVIGAPQRMVQGVAAYRQAHPEAEHGLNPMNPRDRQFLHDQLHTIAQHVFTPTDEQQAHGTQALEQSMHLPSHATIDAFVNQHVPEQLRPYVSSVLKGGEDFGTQTATDPLTYVGGEPLVWGTKALKAAMIGQHVSQLFAGAARAVGLGGHYAQMAQGYDKAAQAISKMLTVRPELNNFFTDTGKKVRLQIENSTLSRMAQEAVKDEHAIASGVNDAAQRYAQYVYNFSTPQKRAAILRDAQQLGIQIQQGAVNTGMISKSVKSLPDFMNMTEEEMQRELGALRHDIGEGFIAKQTEHYVSQFPGAMHAAVTNFRNIPVRSNVDQWLKEMPDWARNALGFTRNTMKGTVFANPLPHGLTNVGQLAYLAGGIQVPFRMLKYGLDAMKNSAMQRAFVSGIPAQKLARMERIGLMPAYTMGPGGTSLWSAIPGWGKVIEPMQHFMGALEEGWRASLLDVVDRKLGPVKDFQDDMLRGHLVNTRVGDYRNQNAVVSLFKAIGGPFVAFRMGIVPSQVAAALRDHPERVLAVVRSRYDLQHNRSHDAQRANDIEMSGPVADFAKLTTDPAKYVVSPSSLGLLGTASNVKDEEGYQSPLAIGAGLVEYNNPFNALAPAIDAVRGTTMPNQNMSLADKLFGATLEVLGQHFYAQKSQKTLNHNRRSEGRRINKQGF